MAQFYFKYGAMNSGKSIEILKVKHNYEEQGKGVILMTSALDTRYGEGRVTSRIGLSEKAIAIQQGDSIIELLKPTGLLNYDPLKTRKHNVYCILVDEAQFLSEEQVKQLAYLVDYENIPVMAFGLKNDFQNKLFEGSRALVLYADKIEEIKTICTYCQKKATMNLRLQDGEPIYEGDQVKIGGNESYVPVCREHYNY